MRIANVNARFSNFIYYYPLLLSSGLYALLTWKKMHNSVDFKILKNRTKKIGQKSLISILKLNRANSCPK